MKRIILLSIYILIVSAFDTYALDKQPKFFNIKGIVKASEDSLPLRSVTVRVADKSIGTITNASGEFKLRLEKGIHHLVFSMVGKEKQLYEIDLQKDTANIIIRLKTISTLTGAVEVIAEDPGMRMMRKAIDVKKSQQKQLNSYKYLLYTKLVTQTDTLTAGRTDYAKDSTIVSLFESYCEAYYSAPDRYAYRITQRRQSANVPPQANFVTFGTNLNIYDDFIKILGEEIYTPFHVDAPDFYDFILDTAYHNENDWEEVRIVVTPNSKIRRLMSGYIYLDKNKLRPIKVELYPNDAVRLPFNTKLTLSQSFRDTQFLMPEKLHIGSTSNANILGLFSPRLDINLQTYSTDYEFNIPIEEKVFNDRQVAILKSADKFDSLYWAERSYIKLSKEEEDAYEAIRMAREAPDSASGTSIFGQYLTPITRQLNKLNRKPFTGWEDMFVYNQIKAFNLNLSLRDIIFEDFEYTAKLGYGFADKKINYEAGLKYFFDELQQYNIAGSVFSSLNRMDNPYVIKNSTISWTSLLTGKDYGDYYYADGAELSLSASHGQLRFIRRNVFERPFQYKIYARSEKQSIARNNTNFALLGRVKDNRNNPPIDEGTINSLGFDVNWNFSRERRLSDFGFYLGGEYSSSKLLASSFDYMKVHAMTHLRQKTLPLWRLDIRLSGGLVLGDVPPQKYFSLESSSSFVSANTSMRGMQQKEFYGNKFAMLSFEHNFGELFPGMIRIPSIAEFGVEFIAYSNVAYSYFDKSIKFIDIDGEQFKPKSTAETHDKYYYEIGLGLNRLLIFFRTDLSVRLSQVEKPKFKFTVTSASF